MMTRRGDRRRNLDRANAGDRAPAFRAQGGARGRRRRAPGDARAVRHAARLEGARAARRRRQCDGRDPAQRFLDRLSHRRRRQCRRRAVRHRGGLDPHDAGPDAAARAAAARARRRPVPGRHHRAQCVVDRASRHDGRAVRDRRRSRRTGAAGAGDDAGRRRGARSRAGTSRSRPAPTGSIGSSARPPGSRALPRRCATRSRSPRK